MRHLGVVASRLPAEIIEHSPHRVILPANADRPGWLALADTFFQERRASVDNRKTPIAPASYAFRAVPVPAGECIARFIYEPASYRVGLSPICRTLAIRVLSS